MAQKDAVVEVADDAVYSYTASANWEPVDKAATTAHNKGEKDEKAAVDLASVLGVVPDPEPEPEAPAADG
jgi:hypothetical protein